MDDLRASALLINEEDEEEGLSKDIDEDVDEEEDGLGADMDMEVDSWQ